MIGGSYIADLLQDGDIKWHIRDDLEKFTARVEKAFEDKAQLKANTTYLGTRLETLEQRFFEALPNISRLQSHCAAQDQKIDFVESAR